MSRYIRQFNEKFVVSDFIKCYTCIQSWELGQNTARICCVKQLLSIAL